MSIGNKSKSDLNLFCQKSRIPIPTYTSTLSDGCFVSSVSVRGVPYSSTSSYGTKKEAENDAAGVALIAILQKEFNGKPFEEVISLLEQKYPSKNKKKSKQSSGLIEVTPQPVKAQSNPQATFAQSQPTFTPVLQSVVTASHPQPVAVWQNSSSQNQAPVTVGHAPQGHPQAMAGVVQPQFGGPPWSQESVVRSQGGQPQLQGSVSQQSAVSANFYSSYPQTVPYQGVYPSGYYAAPDVVMQGGYPPPPPQPHSGVYPIHPSATVMSYAPAQSTYQPRPSTVATTTAASMTPPPGLRPIAARFPGPSAPPGFDPQQTGGSAPKGASPDKPLSAIPAPQADKQGLPVTTARVCPESQQNERTSSEQINHAKNLEEFCRTKRLPAPSYKVNESGKNKFSAEVKIGDKSYRTRWMCNDFEQAKLMAATEALAHLAVSTNTGSSPGKTDSKDSQSATNSQVQSSAQPTSTSSTPTQTTKGQSAISPQSQAQSPILVSKGSKDVPAPQTSLQAPQLHPPSFFKNSPSPPAPNSQAQDQTKAPPTSSTMAAMNYKQILNIYGQKNHIPVVYDCSSSENSVGYIATVKVAGRVFESSPQGTKRAAESSAAEKAVTALGLAGPTQQVDQGVSSHAHQFIASGHPVATTQSVSVVSYKNLLQEHMQKLACGLPHYETERADAGFKSTVRVHRSVGGESIEFTSSPQPVKKAAEQEAAKMACLHLKLIQ